MSSATAGAYVANFTTSPDYVLVEASQDSWAGEYLITYYTSNTSSLAKVLAGKSSAGSYGAYTSLEVNDKTIAASVGDSYKVIIEAVSGTTYYTIKYVADNTYLGWTSGNSLAFSTSAPTDNNNYKWTITYNSNGKVVITNVATPTRELQYNASSPRFACYEGTQQDPSLFKKLVASDPHNITVADGIVNGTVSVSTDSAPAGTTITVTTTPAEGFVTASVTTTPSTVIAGSGTSFTFTMPDEDVVVSATFTEVNCTSGDYSLVTSSSTDWSGEYVIAYGSSGTVTLLNGQNGNYGGTASAGVSSSTISNAIALPYNVTIARNGSCYTIKQGDYYLGYEDNGDYLSFSTSIPVTNPNQYRWLIDYDNGAISILNASYLSYSDTKYFLDYSSNGFECSASTSGMQLFRRASDAPTAPQFSLLEGLYTTSQTLTITSSSSEIYYTTDGNDPDFNSSLYSGQITLPSGVTVLKAIAYNGSCYSTVTTAQYAITGEVIPCSEYTIVTEEQTDWSGNYVITNMSGTTARFLNGVITQANGGLFYGTFATTDVSTDVSTIDAALVDQCKVTITKVGDYYTLKLGNCYLGMYNDVDNRLDYFTTLPAGDEDKCYWTISYTDGEFSITNVRNTTRKNLGFNNNVGTEYDHSRFACYSDNSGNISNAFKLYKQTLGLETTITALAGAGISEVSISDGTTTENGTASAVFTGSECIDVTLTATLQNNYVFIGWYLYTDSESDSTLVSTDLEQVMPIDGNTYKAVAYKPDTWVAAVTTVPSGWSPSTIDSPADLAWLISYVNGYNNSAAHPNAKATVLADLDMDAHAWVPIGNETTPFTGTFEGNGHFIDGIHTEYENTNAGMFGYTSNATIQNTIATVDLSCEATNMGAFIGNMNGGSLNNVEAGGSLTGTANTLNIGGLVGTTTSGSTIHSSFAVNTLTGASTSTVMGGLVGTNGGDLLNSYSNVTISGATTMAGLVGVNNGKVENCYSIRQNNELQAFVYQNTGQINYCYFNKNADEEIEQVNYTPSGSGSLTGAGYYAMVPKTGLYRYLYNDNIVHITSGENTYFSSELTYDGAQIASWPGLLSTLNQWVDANSGSDCTYTSWLRPTTKDINEDLPVLCFGKDNSLATTDGKFLQYAAYDLTDGDSFDNGIDGLLSTYAEQTAYLFLYGNATDVANVPGENVNVFINEDAVLLQSGTGEFINTTVGVSFDNSCKTASDYWGTTLAYDWHLMSTPLKNAPLGITYNSNQHNWWDEEDSGQISSVSGGYLPNGIANISHWDFYCYDEPNYHWINFKRNSSSHYHYDEPHAQITYDNETTLIPGKGYMAAIDKETYLNNTGTLNNGSVSIELTYSATSTATEEPSKDWGSNLVGNPYQAYLDLNKVAEGTKFTKFYVYAAEQNTYVPYVYTQSSNTVTPSQYIHPHQAFFVLTDAAASFTFTYDMATATKDDGSYLREEHINYPVVNLFVNDETGHRDLAIIELERPELGGARKTNALRNANFKVSAHYGDSDYGLLFTPQCVDRVPMHFTTAEDGTYTMTWGTCNGTFTSLFLVDNLTGAHVDMLHNESYTFDASADDYAARFYITYNCMGVEEFDTNENGDFAYFDGNEWIINGQGVLQLVDMTGRVLQSQHLSGEQSRVRLEGYAAGVYVLRLCNSDKAYNQKVVIR
ncbi:MAG: chitobiase/beta-hexosaminidase C-terminal domain-containing protein [Bacteroidales bacterium]|nr:chitobiase/beta-hexosaminidase C-terminal domain-containing protein [Bacteroidales bacterium]